MCTGSSREKLKPPSKAVVHVIQHLCWPHLRDIGPDCKTYMATRTHSPKLGVNQEVHACDAVPSESNLGIHWMRGLAGLSLPLPPSLAHRSAFGIVGPLPRMPGGFN